MDAPAAQTSPLEDAKLAEPAAAVRRCVACGYDLFGLGDQPRCPECGLLNIPEGFRQQVWKLVDANTVFFSNPFNPFKKRLPGWWWALDRPGDLARSVRFAAVCSLASLLVIAGTSILAGSTVWVMEQESNLVMCADRSAGTCELRSRGWRIEHGLLGAPVRFELHPERRGLVRNPGGPRPMKSTTSSYLDFAWSGRPVVAALELWIGILLSWVLPAVTGIWSQLRKGLPSFANAPRTVLAASFYESHRLLYLAGIVAASAIADIGVKIWAPPAWPGVVWSHLVLAASACGALTLYAAVGWVGPLRSDFTRQLIRSRWHASRIILMYAVVLPWLLSVAIMLFIDLTYRRWVS